MAKKQNVVSKEFTLDLGNLGKIAEPKKDPQKEGPKKKVKKDGETNAEKKTEVTQKTEVDIDKGRGEAKDFPVVTKAPKSDDNEKKHLRLVVSKTSVDAFDALFKRFVEETETYWVNTSRVHLFVLGTLFLEQKYKKSSSFHKAPEDFVQFVSRKGMRPKTEESVLRKLEPTPMFFELDKEVFDSYFSIMYSFLLVNEDIRNTSYSGSYFFKDFLDLLQGSFKTFCTYGRKNSRKE